MAWRLQRIGQNNINHTFSSYLNTMKNLFAFALLLTLTTGAFAQSNRATQNVSINVAEIAVISVTGNVSMTIATATAGQAPDAATASSSYAVTTNGEDKKITAELDSDMPKGLTLNATMSAPEKAESEGKKALSKKAVTLVKDIKSVRGSGLALNYEAVATVDAEPDTVTRTVTYTITNN